MPSTSGVVKLGRTPEAPALANRGCAQVELHIIGANLQCMLLIANRTLKMHEGLEIEQHSILRIAKSPVLLGPDLTVRKFAVSSRTINFTPYPRHVCKDSMG